MLHERALAINEKVLGPEHPETAFSLTLLGFQFQAKGDFAGARPLHERVLVTCEKVFGPDHPNTAFHLSGLATCVQAQGDLERARLLLERALTINEKVHGPQNDSTAQSFNRLAILLHDQGELTDARMYYQHALATLEISSPKHPNTNRLRRNFARLLLAAGSAADALAFSETALAGQEAILGRNHRWTREAAGTTADALAALDRADEASALRQRYGLEPAPHAV